MKKESLSTIFVKTLLAVLLFAGIGVIIFGGGCIIWEYSKNKIGNEIVKPVDQEAENYYDVLEKKCENNCCLRSLRIMKKNNYKEADENEKCQEGFEKSFLPPEGASGFCRDSLKWCQPIQTKIVSIETDKIEYLVGEKIEITIKNETDKIIFIPDSHYLIIEGFGDIEWKSVKRDICSWDRIIRTGHYLDAHSKDVYNWNQKTKECDMSEGMTIREQVQVGKYRIRIPYSIREEKDKNKEVIYSKEFTIGEKIVDTSDWQTYRNEEFGYELKYQENKVEIVLDDVFERGSKGNPSFKIKSGGHFALGVWENPKDLTAKEWIDKQYAAYSGGWLWDFKETTVGTEKAFSALRTDMCHIEWVIIPKLNYFYTFGTEICEDNKSISLETFNQILSSFKFIEK